MCFLIEEILKHPKDLLQYFNWNSIELLVIKHKQKCLCMYNNDYKIILINRIGISKTQVSSSDKNISCIELHHIQHYCTDERRECISQSQFVFPSCLSQPFQAAWKDKFGLRYALSFSRQCSNAGCDVIQCMKYFCR